MSTLTTNESADVLMHNGQQYVRVDYLTRAQEEVAILRQALISMDCLCFSPEYLCHRCSILEGTK